MEKSFLKINHLNEFLETLRLFGELNAPTMSATGAPCFAPLEENSHLLLDYQRTQIPPKKYLLPFREEILYYSEAGYRQSHPQLHEIVLFGVHPCDLDGIAYLDRVFLGERPDPCYAARRERLTLIGLSCQPDDFCFCTGSAENSSCDLFLSESQEGFQLSVFSAKGEAIAAAVSDLLQQSTAPSSYSPGPCSIAAEDPQLRFSDHPLWEKFASTCVSCGACSVCCPTCYCFDVREYPALTGGGMRLREWDNCLFVTHGEVAGGANFRGSRLERLRYRFLHKFCGFTPLQGINSCVGCGRCKKVCPVDIDLRELIPNGLKPGPERP